MGYNLYPDVFTESAGGGDGFKQLVHIQESMIARFGRPIVLISYCAGSELGATSIQLMTKAEKKLATVREQIKQGSASKTQKKKEQQYEEEVRHLASKLYVEKMKSSVVMLVVLVVNHTIISRMYDGVVVGQLPFVPIKMFSYITHRGLPGTDLKQMSAFFMYSLCTAGIRPLVIKVMGLSPQQGLHDQMSLDTVMNMAKGR